MSNITKQDLELLEEVLNEELLSYLDSGYSLQDKYVVSLRKLLNKLNLKETYNYDKRFEGSE